MFFCTDFELLGKITEVELKTDGKNIQVTEENKEEYINMMMQWRLTRGQEPQTHSFLDGFSEVSGVYWAQCVDCIKWRKSNHDLPISPIEQKCICRLRLTALYDPSYVKLIGIGFANHIYLCNNINIFVV